MFLFMLDFGLVYIVKCLIYLGFVILLKLAFFGNYFSVLVNHLFETKFVIFASTVLKFLHSGSGSHSADFDPNI